MGQLDALGAMFGGTSLDQITSLLYITMQYLVGFFVLIAIGFFAYRRYMYNIKVRIYVKKGNDKYKIVEDRGRIVRRGDNTEIFQFLKRRGVRLAPPPQDYIALGKGADYVDFIQFGAGIFDYVPVEQRITDSMQENKLVCMKCNDRIEDVKEPWIAKYIKLFRVTPATAPLALDVECDQPKEIDEKLKEGEKPKEGEKVEKAEKGSYYLVNDIPVCAVCHTTSEHIVIPNIELIPFPSSTKSWVANEIKRDFKKFTVRDFLSQYGSIMSIGFSAIIMIGVAYLVTQVMKDLIAQAPIIADAMKTAAKTAAEQGAQVIRN